LNFDTTGYRKFDQAVYANYVSIPFRGGGSSHFPDSLDRFDFQFEITCFFIGQSKSHRFDLFQIKRL